MPKTLTEAEFRKLRARTVAGSDSILNYLAGLKKTIGGMDGEGALLRALLPDVCQAMGWLNPDERIRPVGINERYAVACRYAIWEALTQGGVTTIRYDLGRILKEELIDKGLPPGRARRSLSRHNPQQAGGTGHSSAGLAVIL
ncbi:MAG TPA: hypothetical protein VFD58_27470 [Blastocatellia bacterium]|nr:hypothetical protein [Blastocatellia bacterium]